MSTSMSDFIRYAFGGSSLGRFVAATGGVGVVIFEFGDKDQPRPADRAGLWRLFRLAQLIEGAAWAARLTDIMTVLFPLRTNDRFRDRPPGRPVTDLGRDRSLDRDSRHDRSWHEADLQDSGASGIGPLCSES